MQGMCQTHHRPGSIFRLFHKMAKPLRLYAAVAALGAVLSSAGPAAAHGWSPYWRPYRDWPYHHYYHRRPRRRRDEVIAYPAPYAYGPFRTDDGEGAGRRSEAAKNAFKRLQPCPATGLSTGPCPGYVIDHIIALKRGGADDPSNMQWQTVEEAKAKDKVE